MPNKLSGTAIQSGTITSTQLSATLITTIESGGGPKIASIIYPGNDLAANTVGGQTLYITGSGFKSNSTIYINGNNVPSVSYISASNLSFTGPALSSASYPVYVINPEDGATAILIPGLQVSGEPTWVTGATLTEQDATGTWNISLSATGDAPLTYALAAGSSLPTGISLASNGVISGTITTPPESDTTYNFTVVASDAQNQDSSRAFSVTAKTGEGVLFANNVLLIHADGTNNKNNHTFLDSSNNNFTITRNGNATQGSFSPFSQTGWSVFFDGTSDTITYTGGSSLNFGTSDFTIELWVNMANTNTFSPFLRPDDDGVFPEFGYDWSTSELKFQARNGVIATVSTTAVVRNAWNHIAVSRSGTSLRLFVNGTQVGSTVTNSTNFGSTTGTIRIGGSSFSGSHNINGYLSNFRVVKGTALYTSNFTPPTAALTAVSNTSLLICQSNHFIDNSTNAYTLTRNGGISIQPFSPFAPTAAYSTANVGGSGYFDGSGDYLTVPAGSAFAPGTSDFTIEAWIYPTNSSEQYIWTQTVSGTNYFLFFITSTTGSLTMTTSGGGTPINGPANSIRPYAWNHVAAVRSGGTVTVYVNGVAGTPSTNAQDLTNTSHVPTIGTYNHNTSASPLTGYLASLRYVKGTAVYTTNFTPPTAPLTNIANTSFLCNYTNAGIFDQTAKNVIETVGDAKVSTAEFKYGSGSIAFDGTGDYLVIPQNQLFTLGSADFTAEAWVYLTSSSASTIFWIEGSAVAGGYAALRVGVDAEKVYLLMSTSGSAWAIQSGLLGSSIKNQWAHVAVTRSDTSVRVFVNGTQLGTTYTVSGALMDGSFNWIGALSTGSLSEPWTGYMDDIRITRGYARYTANFTAPTSALKDK
jgi:hypothetical protein